MKAFNPIGWCHFTVNFWWGCAKVSPACAHCYAESLAKVYGKGKVSWGEGGERWIRTEVALKELRSYDEKARKLGVRWRIFINSMSDTFEDRRDLDAPRAALFAIAPTLTNLDLLLLTKRPLNVWAFAPYDWSNVPPGESAWPKNIWLGITAENQEMLDLRFNQLARIPAVIRFISAEPLLGPLDLGALAAWREKLWVICGGESGAHARPMHPDWARGLRDQCAAAGVPFYFKQWGEWLTFIPIRAKDYPEKAEVKHVPFDGDPRPGEFDVSGVSFQSMIHVGKKVAGRMLDGIEHNGFPQSAVTERSAGK